MLYPDVVVVNAGREMLLKDVRMKEERRGWIRLLVVNEEW
jgi:hypothetical protein